MTSPETVATESLVFLVVGLKRFFKAPFAYFLVDKVSSAILSQIIKDSIILIAEAGFHVQALTCDGSYVNQAAMASIGCKFSVDGMNFEFPNPHTPAESISFFMDSCHMLKNVRNCFGDLSVLKHGNEVIEWRFIAELHKLQSSSTLNLANRLKGKHLDYGKNKMKVALAAQTLSSSVASAIDFLRSQGLEMFQGSEATCNFMRVFDEVFDLTNSSNIHAKGFKSPIKACNIDAKVSRIMLLTDYVKNLTDIHGKPLLHSRRKTGFVGFLGTLQSIVNVSRRLLAKNYLCVLTYRFSQDHLETLFSRIRSRGGFNNNPNALQFKYALRSLLQKNGVTPSPSTNCLALPQTDVLAPLDIADDSAATSETIITEPESGAFLTAIRNKSIYHENALHYISGFVQRKLLEKFKCPECIEYLLSSQFAGHFSLFTLQSDRGGLVHAHTDVFTVVLEADRILRFMMAASSLGPLKAVHNTFLLRLGIAVLKAVRDKVNVESQESHPVQIIKFICNFFCNTMLHHFGKIFSERHLNFDKGSIRHSLNKKILFMHQ